jgi:hypothetical protein
MACSLDSSLRIPVMDAPDAAHPVIGCRSLLEGRVQALSDADGVCCARQIHCHANLLFRLSFFVQLILPPDRVGFGAVRCCRQR